MACACQSVVFYREGVPRFTHMYDIIAALWKVCVVHTLCMSLLIRHLAFVVGQLHGKHAWAWPVGSGLSAFHPLRKIFPEFYWWYK
jgi:hypothetical protein